VAIVLQVLLGLLALACIYVLFVLAIAGRHWGWFVVGLLAVLFGGALLLTDLPTLLTENQQGILLGLLALACICLLVGLAMARRWGWLVLVLLAALSGGMALLLQGPSPTKKEEAALKKLESQAARYLGASGEAVHGTPHLLGRIVPINVNEQAIDKDVFIRLPGALQARSPKEVSTVVLIEYRQEVVGQYEDGADELQNFAHLTIVDLVSRRQYKGRTIEGLAPTFVKRGPGDVEGGEVDRGDIADYLAKLPRYRVGRLRR